MAPDSNGSSDLNFMKSCRSLPLVKTFDWPLISTTRTAGLLSACASASAMATYIAWVSAFFFSGRLISIWAIPLFRLTFKVSESMRILFVSWIG